MIEVYLEDDKFRVFLDESQDVVKYACYFYCGEEVSKSSYQSSSEFFFDFCGKKQTYKILAFFKRSSGNIFKEEYKFRIDDAGKISGEAEVCLLEGQDYKIDYHYIGADTTFVVFNGSGSNKKSKAFGLDFLLREGFNVIACYQDNDSQYQSLSLEIFYNATHEVLKGKAVYTYGSSLGGYCAVYYAGIIGANIIAAAPRNSAHPAMLEKRQARFGSDLFKHRDFDEIPITKGEVFLFIDPSVSEDVFFYDKVVAKAYPKKGNINIVEIPKEALKKSLPSAIIRTSSTA